MRTPLLLLLALSAPAFAAKAPASLLPKELEEFLGRPPTKFEQKFRKPALELKAAHQLLAQKKSDQAVKKLQALVNGELAEHALFELASVHRERKEFAQSSARAEKLLRAYPGSVYGERLRDLIDQNECDLGLSGKGTEATHLLQLCLWRTPWKSWTEHEKEASALFDKLRATQDPLFEPFVAELIQAMPAGSALRQKIARTLPADKLDELANLARFRTNSVTPPGVKANFPDLELFDSAMKAVLQENWGEANNLFKRFPAEFPQSEHGERAQFWIARTEEKLGRPEEAKKIFEQILRENPFTYYGMQAAIFLKHDWTTALESPSLPAPVKWTGSLLSRQALSLWRLRALVEVGLVDYAREEARFLAQVKGNGAGIGQDDPRGALMMATLFSEAGNHMAAFSHAYAALSLDPTLLNREAASLIFPSVFRESFAAAGERSGVNPLLLSSVAKQESAFLPKAISRADALGLMQLLAPTAKDVLPKITRDDLFEPGPNTQAGALYLLKLLERFQGNIALALAGYNAGPTRAAQWQRELMDTPLMKKGFDPDAFIDAIPFTETRKYVGNILRNYAWYKLLAKESVRMGNVQELNYQWQKVPPEPPKTEETIPAQARKL